MIMSIEDKLLEKYLSENYMFSHEILTKEKFLLRLWDIFSLIIQYNRKNTLVLKAVGKCPYIIPKSYTIISILYGAFSSEPHLKMVVKEFVCMLNEDIDKKELSVLTYASHKRYSFFPELYGIWKKIDEIYTSGSFDTTKIPVTPYRAFSFFTLNHAEMIVNYTSIDDIYTKLRHLQDNRNELEILISEKKDKLEIH